MMMTGIPTIDEAIEDAEEDADILEVQARSRLVEDIDGLTRVALSELGGQLDTLLSPPERVVEDCPSLI